MEQSFGNIIREARKQKGYSQRVLAEQLGLDFTYLSKLENNRADYAPKEDVIRAIALNLDLDQEQLIFLAGRIPAREEDLLKQHYQQMPSLFRIMRENPEFAQKVFEQAQKQDK